MKKNAPLANNRNRRRRNAFPFVLGALLGAALFVLPTDAAQADDFGFSLNLGCFSLNVGSSDDCCDHVPPVVVAPPKPAPRPIVVAPAKPAPRPIVVAPPKPAPSPIVVAPPKPAPRPIVVAPTKPAPRPIVVAPAKPAPRPIVVAPTKPGRDKAPAVVRGQAPNPRRDARAPRR